MVWKTYLVVANCSAHFLPHRSSYLGLLEVRPIALGPVTKSDNADTRSGQYTRVDQTNSVGCALPKLTVWYIVVSGKFKFMALVQWNGSVKTRSEEKGCAKKGTTKNNTAGPCSNVWGSPDRY